MAKLDKIKFANLIAYIAGRGADVNAQMIEQLDYMIDIDLPEYKGYANIEAVSEMLRSMNDYSSIIPAIKAYRVLTGAGLKEAKDAVEKYRIAKQPASPTKVYPVGAFNTYEQIAATVYGEIYQASSKFKSIKEINWCDLYLATIRDSNIPANTYNDWFLFADKADAERYANSN